MEELRFVLAGYYDGKGYAIKDLKDEMVEYFSHDKVLEMSKIVKIFGVENGKINLEWFKSYYARYVMVYGEEAAKEYFGLRANDNGKFVCYSSKFSEHNPFEFDYSFKFIEFVEKFSFSGLSLVNNIASYFISKNTSIFHLTNKRDELGLFDADCVNCLDIGNLLTKNAVLNFVEDNVELVVLSDLRMHNIVYDIEVRTGVMLIDLPADSEVRIKALQKCAIYIRGGCNLDKVFIIWEGSCKVTVYLDGGLLPKDVVCIFDKLGYFEHETLSESVVYKKCRIVESRNGYRAVL